MDYDLTSPDTALAFCEQATGLSGGDFVYEYVVSSKGDSEIFLRRNEGRFEDVDVRDLRIIGLHFLGSLDGCASIRRIGLKDLQYVLSNDTALANELGSCGVVFDIDNRMMFIDGKPFCIDYDYYRGREPESEEEDILNSIAHRVCYDYCINGFLCNDNIESYGTGIHRRPEFLIHVGKLSEKVEELGARWGANSKSYAIRFFATFDQIQRFQFELSEERSSEYSESDLILIKEWLMRKAIERAWDFNYSLEEFLYIQDDMFIPPEQIISFDLLP